MTTPFTHKGHSEFLLAGNHKNTSAQSSNLTDGEKGEVLIERRVSQLAADWLIAAAGNRELEELFTVTGKMKLNVFCSCRKPYKLLFEWMSGVSINKIPSKLTKWSKLGMNTIF